MMKKLIIKKAIASFAFCLRSFCGGDEKQKGVRVLSYHSIPESHLKNDYYQMTTPKDIFEEQLRYIKENGYQVLSCEKILEALHGGNEELHRAVCITFDDGFKDNFKNAFPLLKKYNFKGTIFLTLDFIGKKGFLDWDEIEALLESKVFSFGSHSLSHKRLCGLNGRELEEEIGRSKSLLEDKLKTSVDLFAYPFGSYGSFDGKTMSMVKAKGYRMAFTTIAGCNTTCTDLFKLKRTRISWFDDRREFPRQLAGGYDWYQVWQRISRTP